MEEDCINKFLDLSGSFSEVRRQSDDVLFDCARPGTAVERVAGWTCDTRSLSLLYRQGRTIAN